ncbi:hypothetical protein ACFYT4_30880 [Streptomyces sp. NPDC004609]|uniref:hypothetical protein n=1 Tax=Streptomyces sp. NPDC004609 TaxID=3364704 RepID=UPI0036C989F1
MYSGGLLVLRRLLAGPASCHLPAVPLRELLGDRGTQGFLGTGVGGPGAVADGATEQRTALRRIKERG